ncbi:Gfo/Idh/MocA family oxidoreductase [Microbacterium sp. ARD32]|uniref:Gfo/Idh/MocA family protein n=1 Tax=Microbacterium sp. ARD32 TaxID=2962577 RepID=UPI002882437F|nr:Gfo/Idh/MocA family oxidoreductase [Microbacterium sp. ARD32]MDT0157122.1 Gfo/Idh/MocA family oxidoreductase [Microbacterium sp. ARD32]
MTGREREALRLAVVGVGARSSIAQHAVDSGRGRVVAFVDPDPSAALRAERIFGHTLTGYSHQRELIEGGTPIDAAFVTSPDHTHAEIAIDLLRAGIPVYLEKPLATTLDGADEILATAAATRTPLYVGHNMRHMAVIRLMKEIIDRGEIGEVKAVWCRHFVGNGGDYYFKDWHADRTKTTGLLLQKGAHDIDIIHWLAGGYSTLVSGMGALSVYGGIRDRRENSGRLMPEWFSFENWPPTSQTGLNPVVDVEDISMMLMELDNGVLASYEQCHFTPDYWRNYTVIGTKGRLENFGDTDGGVVRVWNRRHEYSPHGDAEYPIRGDASGHDDADERTVNEFLDFLEHGTPTVTSPLASRNAVAAGIAATHSLRSGSVPIRIRPAGAATADPGTGGPSGRIPGSAADIR